MPRITVDFSHLREGMNDVQYRAMFCKERNILQQGGAGSGKSWGVADWIHYWTLTEYDSRKPHKWLIARKVARTSKNSTYQLMKDTVARRGTGILFEFTENLVRCKNGASWHFLGLDDSEKLKSFEGATGSWFEEATEGCTSDFDELIRRVRGQSYYPKRNIFTFNPISERTDLYRYFYEQPVPNTRIIKTTWRDNRFFTEEDARILTGYKEGSLNRLVYDKGEWGRLEGLVYPAPIVVNEFPITDWLCYGMDFGYTHPSTLLMVGGAGDNLYIDEVFYETQQTEADLIRLMEARKVRKDLTIWADSAQASAIKALSNAGYSIRPVNKALLTVTDGVKKVLEYTLHCTPNSVNYQRECNSYQWENKNKDVPVDANNHSLDAKRYAVIMTTKGASPMVYSW